MRNNKSIYIAFVAVYYFTTNSFAQWTLIQQPSVTSVNSVAYFNGDSLMAGTVQGLFVASQDGSVWKYDDRIGSNAEVFDIKVSGSDIFVYRQGGLFVSNDNGNSYSQRITAATFAARGSIAINGSFIMVSINGEGVYLSNDGGNNFTIINSVPNNAVFDCEFEGNTLWIGTSDGAYKSVSGGSSWELVVNGLFASDKVISFAYDGTFLYAGTETDLYKWDENNQSWFQWGTPNGLSVGVVYDILSGEFGYLYAATSTGIYKYESSWQLQDGGLNQTAYPVYQARCLVRSGSKIAAGIERFGVSSKSSDAGSWLNHPGIIGDYINRFCTKGSFLGASAQRSGAIISGDNAANWSKAGNSYPITQTNSVKGIESYIVAATNQGIFKSDTLDLINWTSLSGQQASLPATGINDVAMYGNKLFAGTQGQGLWTSGDFGLYIWEDNPISGIVNGSSVRQFLNKGDTLFILSNSGISFLSQPSQTSITGVGSNGIPFIPSQITWNADTLWALRTNSNSGADVFFTSDMGQNWENVTPFVGGFYNGIKSFTANGRNYVLLHGSSRLMLTDDGGKHWTDIKANIPFFNEISATAVHQGSLFLASPRVGIYKRQLSTLSTLSVVYLVDSTCSTGNTGIIDVSQPSGGVPPYTYWKNGSLVTPPIVGLGAGTYTMRIQDSEGSQMEMPVTINVSSVLGGKIKGNLTVGQSFPIFDSYDTLEVRILDYQTIANGYNTTVASIRMGNNNTEATYEFGPLSQGIYKVHGRVRTLETINIQPTYFGQTLNWSDADTIVIPAGCPVRTANINLPILNNLPPENGSISGSIYFGIFKEQGVQTNNDPIPLIDVVIEKDSAEKYITNATDENNDGVFFYRFTNLPRTCFDSIFVNLAGVRMLASYYPCLTQIDTLVNHDFCADTTGSAQMVELTTCNGPVGIIEEVGSNEINVWPIPGNGYFYIETKTTFDKIKLHDFSGREIPFSLEKANDGIRLNIELPGIYFLTLSFENRHKTIKLINTTE